MTNENIYTLIYIYRDEDLSIGKNDQHEKTLALFSVGPTTLPPRQHAVVTGAFFCLGGRKPCRGMAQLAIEEPNFMYFFKLQVTSNSNVFFQITPA